MTSVEDRLRDLGAIVVLPDLPTVEELVRRREDRRRRSRVLSVVAAVSLIGAALVALQRVGGTQGSQDLAIESSPDAGSQFCDVSSMPSGVTVEALSADGVPAVLVTELRRERTGESGELESAGIAVIDLDKGSIQRPASCAGFAFWAQDDRTAVVADGRDVTAIDTVTGETTTIQGRPTWPRAHRQPVRPLTRSARI